MSINSLLIRKNTQKARSRLIHCVFMGKMHLVTKVANLELKKVKLGIFFQVMSIFFNNQPMATNSKLWHIIYLMPFKFWKGKVYQQLSVMKQRISSIFFYYHAIASKVFENFLTTFITLS